MESKNMCAICLYTNVKLKLISSTLSVYHDELTDYTLLLKNPVYCSICESLLRKTYNFHKKCAESAKILNKWMKTTKKDKEPAKLLHLKFPSIINLDVWTPKKNKVFHYTSTDYPDMHNEVEKCASDEPDTVILEDLDTTVKLGSGVLKDENVENVIPSEKIFKIELKHESQVTMVSDTYFSNGSEDIANVFDSKFLNENPNDYTFTNNRVSVENNTEAFEMNRFEKNVISTAKQANHTTSGVMKSKVQTPYIMLDIDAIKNHINKINPTKPSYEKSLEVADNKSKLNKDLTKVNINKTTAVDLELICLNDDDNKNEIIVIDDENVYPDDANLNSGDDCDDYLIPPPKKRRMKIKSLDELVDKHEQNLNDDCGFNKNESINRSDGKDSNMDDFISTERSITSKLESIDKTLDSICENWEVTSLTGGNILGNIPKDELKKMIHTYLTERRILHPERFEYVQKIGVLSKIRHMSSDLDFIHERCVNTVEDYKIGLFSPKERLKEKLKKWDRLMTTKDEDYVFNKDIILNNLNMVSDRLIQRLLNSMQEPNRLDPGAARILRSIQEKQQDSQYESVFDIEYLTTEKEKLEEFERRKTYECYVKAEYKCELCYQGFKGEGYLAYHKKYHDEKHGQFACPICHIRHYSERGHRKHMLLHQEVYKCKLCPLVTYYRYSMINHYKYHKGTIYKCDKCSKTYKSRSAFMFHQSRAHPRGDHVCSICGNAFVSEQGLHSHALRKHRGESSAPAGGAGFSCEECVLSFTSEEACLRHRRIAHGTRLRQPHRASRKLQHSALTKPRRKPNMPCPECNAMGESYGWMVKHFNIEHPTLDIATVYARNKVHLCDVCGKGFANKYSLRDHMDFHSGVTFPCPSCSKQFSSQLKLSQHRLRHGPPTYCCERCGKKFHSYSNLYNHMRTHIGDRRFKCQICGKGFLHRCSLTAHIRGVHNQERRVRKRGPAVPTASLNQGAENTDELGITEMDEGLDRQTRDTTLNKK